nr:MAG TPA: hypothetical protein [Caudoviricetes sp.]
MSSKNFRVHRFCPIIIFTISCKYGYSITCNPS